MGSDFLGCEGSREKTVAITNRRFSEELRLKKTELFLWISMQKHAIYKHWYCSQNVASLT
jgi:hypothetical protein